MRGFWLSTTITLTTCLLAIALLGAAALAVPPAPEAIEKWKAQGILDQKLANWKKIDGRSGSFGAPEGLYSKEKIKLALDASMPAVETVKVVVVLMEFTDQPHTLEASKFDSLLFSDRRVDAVTNPTGSWTDFYIENSYGTFYVQGEVYGWYTAPETYAYYVGENDGDYAAELANHAAAAVDEDINFADYVKDGETDFHGLIVVHSGCGAEAGCYGIWSHRSQMFPTYVSGGISVSDYTMNPELYGGSISTVGVFCHEFGHTLGLPDFYDTDYSSAGLGDWAVMAGGSWNGGSRGGDTPSHFHAFSKIYLGFVDPIIVDTNNISILQAEIPQVESEPVVYKLVNLGATIFEYFLVENRQRVGFDAELPGDGLLIFHVDEYRPGNSNEPFYLSALEQADGRYQLETSTQDGDAGDPWPGSTNARDFHDFSTPNSRMSWDSAASEIGVWNISDSDSLMYADLEAQFTHPWITLNYDDGPALRFEDPAPGGDGDGILEPGETIEFYCTVKNVMYQTFDPRVILHVDYPGVVWGDTMASLGMSLNPSDFFPPNTNTEPITFTVPLGIDPVNVTFTMTIISDATINGVPEADYSTDFVFDGVFGVPDVLVVDDDNGADWDAQYRTVLNSLGYAWGRWDKAGGSPSASDLLSYPAVIWHTGMPAEGGRMTTADVAAMSGYLDGGGNLMITSLTAAHILDTIAPTFLSDYMHCTFDSGNQFSLGANGITGNILGDGTAYQYDGTYVFPRAHDLITPVGGGQAAFKQSFANGVLGVNYDGDYKSVMLTFPLEFIDDNYPGYQTNATLLQRVMSWFDGTATGIFDDVFETVLPGTFSLSQNYPNPFNPTTEIAYAVGKADGGAARVTLTVYNVLGQDVRTLVDRVQAPGTYTVTWDGRTDEGQTVSSGVYFYRLTQGDRSEARKMLLLK